MSEQNTLEAQVPTVEATSNSTEQAVQKKKKKKPARVQVESSVLDEDDKPQQLGSIFNIWYYNWGAKDKYQKKSPYRVNVKQDSGYTKADKIPNSFICLFFARGCCHKGKSCEYLHRLPNVLKDSFPITTDCFGRDKFSDYREDMGGVGNFMRPNKTLYIGKLLIESVPKGTTIEELLSENFQEFGTIERMRVIHSKNCAFITFENEWNAQFAKEAMAHQSIIRDEILNLRWANEDPNPQAKVRSQKQLQHDTINTIKQILNKPDTNAHRQPSPQAPKVSVRHLQAARKPKQLQNKQAQQVILPAPSVTKTSIVDRNPNKRARPQEAPVMEETKKLKSAANHDKSGLVSGYASSSDEDDD